MTATFSQHRAGIIAQIVGWAVLSGRGWVIHIAAGRAEYSLGSDAEKKGIVGTIKGRLLSFGMILSIAFVLLVSVGINAIMTAAGRQRHMSFRSFRRC